MNAEDYGRILSTKKSRASFSGQNIQFVIDTLQILAKQHPDAKISTVIRGFKPWIEMEYVEVPHD